MCVCVWGGSCAPSCYRGLVEIYCSQWMLFALCWGFIFTKFYNSSRNIPWALKNRWEKYSLIFNWVKVTANNWLNLLWPCVNLYKHLHTHWWVSVHSPVLLDFPLGIPRLCYCLCISLNSYTFSIDFLPSIPHPFLLVYVCGPAVMYMHQVCPGVWGGQKKLSNLLELELEDVVSHLMGVLGTKPESSAGTVKLGTDSLCLQPQTLFLKEGIDFMHHYIILFSLGMVFCC